MASSSEEEEEEEGDTFDVSAELPSRDLEDDRPPPNFNRDRRGSVVQIGGKTSAISITAEVTATLKRMREADASNDINQMQAALTSAGTVAAMAGPGDPHAMELQMLAMQLASRIETDEEFAAENNLRKSGPIRERIRRLWDLMVMESAAIRADAGGAAEEGADVTREGYRQMHVRVSRTLCDPSEGFDDMDKALALADKDWAADISRFSGTSHITVWLSQIRTKFREASARAVGSQGFEALFKRYDADGSGELDEEEFTTAVRMDLGVSEGTLSPPELKLLFRAVDADGSGEVDADEFTSWLFSDADAPGFTVRSPKRASAAPPCCC